MSGFDKSLIMKKSAELLMSGAVMLASHCPKCGAPLFKLKSGEIVCPIHGRVIIAKSEEDVVKASTENVLMMLEDLVSKRIGEICKVLSSKPKPMDYEEERIISRVLIDWLTVLEKIKSIKSIRSESKS